MNINITESEKTASLFISSDLSLVTAVSMHYPFHAIDRKNPRKAKFIFTRSSQLDELVSKYWRKKLLVEPTQFFDQLKAIKSRLYSSE